jgi:hypothetical protein
LKLDAVTHLRIIAAICPPLSLQLRRDVVEPV